VRQVLADHDIALRYPDASGLETTLRVAPDGTRFLFLLNHRDEPVEVTAGHTGTDLLTGTQVRAGQRITLEARAVLVLRTQ
jgi:beta-galactosidase